MEKKGVKAIDLVDFEAMSTNATFFKKGDSWDFLAEFQDDDLEAVVTQIGHQLKMDPEKARLLLKKAVMLVSQATRDTHTHTRQ